MLSSLRVGPRLLISFVLIALIGAAIGAIGIHNMGDMDERGQKLYDNELIGLSLIKEANINLLYTARTVRTIALSTEPEQRANFTKRLADQLATMKDLIRRAEPTFQSPEGRALLQKQAASASRYEESLSTLTKLLAQDAASGGHAGIAFLLGEYRDRTQNIDDVMTELAEFEEKQGALAISGNHKSYVTSTIVLSILTAVGVLLGVVLGFQIARSVTRPLASAVEGAGHIAAGDLSRVFVSKGRDELADLGKALEAMRTKLLGIVGDVRSSSESVATASTQIAQGNLDLSSRTEQQASSLQQTAASLEEFTSTVKQNADSAQQASELATQASDVASAGGKTMRDVVDTMHSIDASSKRIAEIIGVIDGIAFQTNILALNAAVEAARAGEQGRGFAVVASEVRSLAQRSGQAAKEIKGLITDATGQVDAGSRLVESAGSTMHDIVQSVKRVSDIVSEIAAASREQGAGIEQINAAVTQMDQVTQQNAALVEEAAAANGSLEEQAGRLKTAISYFH
ncbi:methyl-accepting chemotaxis protein [soil metagenome]